MGRHHVCCQLITQGAIRIVTRQGFSSEPESEANESGDRTLKPDPIFKPKGNKIMLQLAKFKPNLLADHISGIKGVGSELAIILSSYE